jgi:hypothetical protein
MLINLCFSQTCTTDLTLCSSALPLALYVLNTLLQDALKRDIATLLTLHKVATKRESDLMITKQQLQYQVSFTYNICQTSANAFMLIITHYYISTYTCTSMIYILVLPK